MRSALFAWFVVLAPAGLGCGGVSYAARVNAAETRLEQARQAGAEQTAPFEYYYAREHLHQARVEAAGASYGDAAAYADTAEAFAQKALDAARTQKAAP